MEPLYAGHLCATHVGEVIRIGGDRAKWVLRIVMHSYERETVRVVLVSVGPGGARTTTHRELDPRTVIHLAA